MSNFTTDIYKELNNKLREHGRTLILICAGAGDIISYKITYNDAGNTGIDWAASTAPSLTYTGRGI